MVAQPVAAGAPGAAPAQESWMGKLGGVFRMMLMMYFVRQYFGGQSTPTTTTVDPASGKPVTVVKNPHSPAWMSGQVFNIRVYTSDAEDTPVAEQTQMLWQQDSLSLDWLESNNQGVNLTLPCTPHMANNGSMWAHIYFIKKGYSHVPTDESYKPEAVAYKAYRMNAYRPKPKIHAKKNLISGQYGDDRFDPTKDVKAQVESAPEIVSYWRPTLYLRLVLDFTTFPAGGIPAPLSENFVFLENNQYYPVIHVDNFWLLNEHMIAINDTVKELPLNISYSPISLLKWQFQLQMEQSWKNQEAMGGSEGETQEFKRMLLETNPYLMGITIVVSTLHMVFDFLAFKNDIAFWRNNKTMEGLSVQSIFLNTFCQVVIFLYLLDNDTSWLVLISAGLGCVIEFWKITRAVNVTIDKTKFPFIKFTDKSSYALSDTARYDREAMRYLSYLLYPLVIGYSIYSLYYDAHKSWYSWVIGSLVGAVYAFGFIMMCPQLYLNYKLKSVAHLPWRMLTYKALNTFIDDLFAFIIKMPTMHRLSVFRDDLVFFVYLYQRWIYRVDYTRVNEFGLQPVDPNAPPVDPNAPAAVAGAAQPAVAVAATAGADVPAIDAERKTEEAPTGSPRSAEGANGDLAVEEEDDMVVVRKRRGDKKTAAASAAAAAPAKATKAE